MLSDTSTTTMITEELYEWLEELMGNIQIGGDWLWIMTDMFPETMKGECAKPLWGKDVNFNYGMEYGALVIMHYLQTCYDSSQPRVKMEEVQDAS